MHRRAAPPSAALSLPAVIVLFVTGAGCSAPGAPPSASTPATASAPTPHAHGEGHGFHHRFDDAEGWAKVFDDPARDAWQQPEEVVRALALAPGMTVADLGAGTGYFVERLARGVGASGRVFALDVEESMVRHVRERAAKAGLSQVEGKQVTARDPGLEARSVDRILVVDTWHHLDDRAEYTRRLARALRPGGFVLVVDYEPEASMGPPRRHRLPASTVAGELRAAGLVAEVVDEGLPHQYMVRGKAAP